MANTAGRLGRERRGSMGDIEEHFKRKRNEEEEDIFKKSRKVGRSPTGKEEGGLMKEMFRELREELREGLKGVREEIREVAEGQKDAMRKEVEKMKDDLKVREEKWNREREEMRGRIQELERVVEGMKLEKEKGGGEGQSGEGGGGGQERGNERVEKVWEDRMERLERRYELKEREERKRNFVLKGLGEGVGDLKVGVEEVMKRLGVEVKAEEIRKIELGGKKKGNLLIVKVGSEEEKRRVMQNKWKLKGGDIWIEEDLTWEERKIKWMIRRVAWKEEAEGRRVRVGQGKVWIEGVWWVWDEWRGELRDGRGRSWEEVKGEIRQRKGEGEENEAERGTQRQGE